MRYFVKDIVEYLSDEFGGVWLGNDSHLYDSISRINTDQSAAAGDLSWISTQQYEMRPLSVYEFAGSLLIAPIKEFTKTLPVVTCESPKLAFIFTVNKYFGTEESNFHDGIGENVSISNNVRIAPYTVIDNAVIGNNVRIGANCSIGLMGFGYEKDDTGKYWRFPHLGKVIIEDDVEIGSNVCIDRGAIGDTVIGRGTKIDNLVHVAHNVRIGNNCLVIANSMIGGSTIIGDNTWVAPSVSILDHRNIGESSILGMGAVIIRDVKDFDIVVGNPAKVLWREKHDA